MKRVELGKITSILLIALCFNSVLYYNISNSRNEDFNPFYPGTEIIDNSPPDDYFYDDYDDYNPFSNRIKTEIFEGDYKTQAFFSFNTFTTNLDGNGSGYQWTEYDAIPSHSAVGMDAERFGTGDITNAVVPSVNDTYYLMGADYWGSGRYALMYSPLLTYDTTISDKVHYIFNMHRDLNDDPFNSRFNNMDSTLKITLWHFETSTLTSTEITSVEYLMPKINTPTDTEYWEWLETNSSFSSYTIPAGDRFKITYMMKYNDVGATAGHYTLDIMADGLYSDTGILGTNLDWTITDGVHSNNYVITSTDGMLGVQLYMIEENTPDITFYNAINDTVYYTAQEMNIDVTPGSTSSYRWDYGSWQSFSTSTTTTLPAVHAWHYLEIRASETEYNNTRYEYYQFIYDASETNFELHAPYTNGSTITGGILLNFTVYYVDTATYEWDKNGTQFPLTDPYDIITPDFELDHNITIRTSDFYMNETLRYFFTFNSDLPSVTLDNVLNGGTYAPLKTIDVEIFDSVGIKDVQYHWDSDSNLTWTPATGNIYRTNLPLTDGVHVLHIYALDNYDQAFYTNFNFITDSNIFLVELQNLSNDSYVLGGETVKITIQKSNGTAYFVWDSGAVKVGTITSQTMTLAGANSLPTSVGSHNLTIIAFDTFDVEYVFYFKFIVDIEAPNIVPDEIYSFRRYVSSGTTMYFTITDNEVFGENLTVLISIDGTVNETLSAGAYFYNLDYLVDGTHSFYLYAIDLAGNSDILYVEFTIDNTPPELEYKIPELVPLGSDNYVPGNAEVIVTVSDAYSGVITYYTWGGEQHTFNESFVLPAENASGTLIIYAYDGLHTSTNITSIIIDIEAPSVTLIGMTNTTEEVNFYTALYFETSDDLGDNTIELVRYSWDILPGAWYTSSEHDFNVSVIPFYEHEDNVVFYVYMKDIVGNNHIEWFIFKIDDEPPNLDLEFYDASEEKWLDIGDSFFAQSNQTIRYNSYVNEPGELITFNYYWAHKGPEEYKGSLNVTEEYPTFETPETDGNYTLVVILIDNVNNEISFNITFLIDNIVLTFNRPDDFDESTNAYVNTTSLIYGENVSYIVEVTDSLTHSEIVGLKINLNNSAFDFIVNVTKLDSITYEILIVANNVTDSIFAKIEIQFYKWEESKQYIQIYLKVDKKEGSLFIHQSSVDTVTYGEIIPVIIYLQNDLGLNETILSIVVNGLITDIKILGDGLYQFNFSSTALTSKGNHTLDIQVQSEFFYGSNSVFTIEVLPIQSQISVEVTSYEVLEESQVVIRGLLTADDGTPLSDQEILVYVYIVEESNGRLVYALNIDDYDDYRIITVYTDADGYFTASFQMYEGIEYIDIEVFYDGNNHHDISSSVLDASVYSMKPPGLPSWLLYTIIGGSVLLGLIVSLIIYKIVKPKPFEALMEKITDEQIALNYSIMSPGVVLSIFDQRKGPVPLVMDHSLELGQYVGRLRMGTENFILKISDQAYSSLGFEEHDTGRRVGSIVLPGEKMVGWVHGIQLPNETARGGFENLSLIVLADSEYSNLLLNYQDYLYDEADKLVEVLKAKNQLDNIKIIIEGIRKKSVIIMLAAQGIEEK